MIVVVLQYIQTCSIPQARTDVKKRKHVSFGFCTQQCITFIHNLFFVKLHSSKGLHFLHLNKLHLYACKVCAKILGLFCNKSYIVHLRSLFSTAPGCIPVV